MPDGHAPTLPAPHDRAPGPAPGTLSPPERPALEIVIPVHNEEQREIPVRWEEDADSRVAILATAWQDLRGVTRLRRQVREMERGVAGGRRARDRAREQDRAAVVHPPPRPTAASR